jgi:DNA-binding response OmpR family regulator
MSAEPQRILVVDDEESIRDVAGTSLELAGYEVRTERDGYAALRTVAEFAPHLILLDINMPGIDGLEVCRRLRESGQSAPVIVLTARDAVDDTVAGFAAGGDDYNTNPFHSRSCWPECGPS